jgi:tRNA A-37 threonylcarbamoyl transferase component Bud32/tetratricopeptide (TPR) repeat protein
VSGYEQPQFRPGLPLPDAGSDATMLAFGWWHSMTDLDESGTHEVGLAHAELEGPRQPLRFSLGMLLDERYVLEQMLGRGAMGEVYLAHDRRLDRRVALKLVRAHSPATALRLQARLEREARALARVEHPNVVGIHDVGTHAGQTYFTMQYVPGTTLRKWQKQRRSRAQVIDAYIQAARGLAAAHSVGVVHRDFKPDNVIVGADHIVRVLDFGLASALVSPDATMDSSTSSAEWRETARSGAHESAPDETMRAANVMPPTDPGRMARTGTLLGTVPYMSSEQLAGREADPRSDQFGFCVAMWEALTGERPFVGTTPFLQQQSIGRGPRGGEDLPRRLRGLLTRGLAREPQRRWPSMGVLVHELERGQARKRRLLLVLASMSGLAGAAVFGFMLAGKPEPQVSIETCEIAGEIDKVWTSTARDAILAHRSDAAEYVVHELDGLAEQWKDTANASCERMPGSDDSEQKCLQRWLIDFGTAVDLLSTRGDDKTVARGPDLLAQLAPREGNYCALVPTPIDAEVQRMAERARALSLLGDFDAAREEADKAVQRAEGLDALASSVERAVAFAARGWVHRANGEHAPAIADFQLALYHALAVDAKHEMLRIWTLLAKTLSQGKGFDLELAPVHAKHAEAMLRQLEVAKSDPRYADVLEANGLHATARGDYERSIPIQREALEVFREANLPTRAAQSLINIAVNLHKQGKLDEARHEYERALALLDAAGLPPSYRNRVRINRSLGLLAYESLDLGVRRRGLAHYEFMIEHGNAREQLDGYFLGLALVLDFDDPELTKTWIEGALAALAAQPEASVQESFNIHHAAGSALFRAGDPRGEEVLREAEVEARSLSLQFQFNLQKDWITWLEEVGRCDEARERRERLVSWMGGAEGADDLVQQYALWREAGLSAACNK